MADRSAEPERRPHDDERGASTTLVIVVVRTGGFAGLRREWRVEPPSTEEPDWLTLVEACDWAYTGDDPTSRDRFVWSISVTLPREHHSATLPERDLTGPWRTLVDRVQDAGREDDES